MMSVSIHLVPCLGLRDAFAKVSMERVKIHSEFESGRRCEITFGMDREVRVVAFVGKEGRDTGGLTRSVVVGEFSEGKKG